MVLDGLEISCFNRLRSEPKLRISFAVPSPDAAHLLIHLAAPWGRSVGTVGLSPYGETSDASAARWYGLPEGASCAWASPSLLAVFGGDRRAPEVHLYEVTDSGVHPVARDTIDVPATIVRVRWTSGAIEALVALGTRDGVRFALYSGANREFRLLTDPLRNPRFGSWNPTTKTLAVNVPADPPSVSTSGMIYRYDGDCANPVNLSAHTGHPTSCGPASPIHSLGVTGIGLDGVKLPGVLAIDSYEVAWVGAEARGMEPLRFSVDGSRLLAGAPFGVDWRYVVSNEAGHILGSLDADAGVILDPAFCANPRYIVGCYESPGRRPIIARWDTETALSVVQVDAFAEPEVRVKITHVWPMTERDAALLTFTPPGGSIGQVMYLHGGPHVNISKAYSPLIAQLVSGGMEVIVPNFPGSTGYGESFASANRGDWGGVDLASVLEAADRAVASRSKPLALYGVSYGGYLALLAAAQRPELWSRVVVCAPVSDLWDLYEYGDERMRGYLAAELGPLLLRREELLRRSPVFWVRALNRAPILVIHGSNDATCPIRQSRTLVEKARRVWGDAVTLRLMELPGVAHEAGSEFLWVDEAVDFIRGPEKRYPKRMLTASDTCRIPNS